jgi:defect in organelle trafficking protein DotD
MKTFMVACTVLMLSACSRDISTHSLVTPQAHITHSAQDIQNTTGMLYQADAINQVRSSLLKLPGALSFPPTKTNRLASIIK